MKGHQGDAKFWPKNVITATLYSAVLLYVMLCVLNVVREWDILMYTLQKGNLKM